MYIFTRSLATLLFISIVTIGWGQSIFTNPITGTNPNTSNPYTAGQTVASNLTVSGIGRGTGITGTNANNRYNANSWNTAAIDLTAYFEFTLTPATGYEIDFTSFVYSGQASGTGATNVAIRSSVDSYGSNIGSPTIGGTTISLSAAAYQNVSSGITFRVYGWGASAAAGSFSIDDFTFNGAVVSIACNAPTLSTSATSSINTTSADLNGNITALGTGGATSATTRGFQYSTSNTLASPTTINTTGTYSTGAYTQTASSLTANTLYYFRSYAINNCGTPQTGYSHTSSFPTFTTIHNAPTIGSGSAPSASSFTASWTAPVSGGSASFTYQIEVDNDPLFGSVDFTQNAITSATLNTNATGLASNTTYYYRVRAVNAGGNSAWSSTSSGIATLSPAPEINIQGNSNTILDGDNSPATLDHTDFGNVALGNSFTRTFTIQNTGTAALNISGSSPYVLISGSEAGDFSITTPPSNSIAASGFTTFVVTFTPTSVGARNATLTINNNDSDEAIYNFDITGNGTPSALSDIVTDGTFTYSSNIAYTNFQANPITNTLNSVSVLRFIIRDGGVTASDFDASGTELNAISFTVANIGNIRSAALFDGNTMLNNTAVIGGGLISFSGLSGVNYTAPDNSTRTLSLRVSFLTTVTDNDQLQFTINTATANASGSSFSASNAGGATSSTTGDRNRIEVTADRLAFVQQPSTTSINLAMTPAVTLSANDINNNRDVDFTGSVSLTSTGTLTTTPITVSAIAGLTSFSSITHTAAGTGLSLNATSIGLLGITSNNFDITTIANNSYRTASNGTWPTTAAGNATWERFTAGTWNSTTKPAANTTDILYILHTVTSNGAFAASGGVGTKMTIESGGSFVDGHNSTLGSLQINNGGTFTATDPGVDILSGTGTVTVESGGRLVINSGTLNHADGFFGGIENFKSGSTFEIQNYDYDSSPGEDDLIESTNPISTNTAGYYFGNLFINNINLSSKVLCLVGVTGTHKLCENDLIITNNAASTRSVLITNVNANVEIGDDLIVNQNVFAFASTSSSDITHTVKGDIIGNGGTLTLNQTNSGASGSVTVNLEGNLIYNDGTITNTDAASLLVFKGSTLQNLDIENDVAMVDIPMVIDNNASVQLINQNLLLGNNSSITVNTGGTFNFNFDGSDNPLILSEISSGNATSFITQTGSTIKITSPVGITTSGNTGNVQTDTRTYDVGATYHYIGKANQVTGNGLPNNITGKVIVEMNSNSLSLTPNSSRSIIAGGELDIKRGILIESNGGSFFDGAGALTMTDGLYQIATVNTGAIQLPRLSGTYTLTGGVVELNGNTTGASDRQTLRGAAREYYNLKISGTSSGGGYKNIPSAVVVKNNLEITGNAIFDIAGNGMTGNGGITMDSGRLRMSKLNTPLPELAGTATNYAVTGGTIEFYGSGASQNQLIRNSDGAGMITYSNLEINSASANTQTGTDFYNVSPAASIGISGNLNVNSPSVFRLDEAESIQGLGNMTLSAGSTLLYASPNGIKTSGIGTNDGNIRVSGTRTFPTTASYGFVGNGSMVSGNGLPSTVENLYVDKGNSTDNITLNANVTVNNTLKMQQGYITTGSNTIELGTSTAATGTLNYTAGRVYGIMKRWFSGTNSGISSGLFPLGVSTFDRFSTVEYGSAPSSGGSLTARFTNTAMGLAGIPISGIAGTCGTFNITSTANEGYWQIDAADGLTGGNYDITLVGEGITTITDICQLTAIKRVGAGNWLQSGTHADPTGTIARPVVKRSGASGWSNWGFGGGNVNPLPVELTSFTGRCSDDFVTINWTTASEINSEKFVVERSEDLQLFEYITEISAAGNSNKILNYEITIPRTAQTAYYRLKQEDFDGAFEYFGPVSISCDEDENWLVFVNHNILNIAADGISAAHYVLKIYDMNGKIVFTENMSQKSKTIQINKDLNMFNSGMYLVTIQSISELKTFKIIISK